MPNAGCARLANALDRSDDLGKRFLGCGASKGLASNWTKFAARTRAGHVAAAMRCNMFLAHTQLQQAPQRVQRICAVPQAGLVCGFERSNCRYHHASARRTDPVASIA